MSIPGFIARNALRNKRRALLSILSVAMSLLLLVLLLAALRELTVPPQDTGSAARVIVRSKVSLAISLPASQRPIIEKIPGVEAVTPFTWYGGTFKNEEGMTFAQFAIDPTTIGTIMGEANVPKDQMEAFIKDRTSCLLGKKTADKYHLKVGDRVPLKGAFAWPFDLDFKIAGIYQGSLDDRNMFFHHKYFDEANGDAGIVGTWWVKAKTLEDVPKVVAALNKAFENTSAEVRAETERAFQLSFVSMWGNIKGLVHSICIVVVFTLFLVSASTMSMAIRERFRELAILKAIGFRRRELFALILAESFGLAAIGASIGVGIPFALLSYANSHGMIPDLTGNMFVLFEVTPRIVGQACLIAAGLGVLASLAPSISVARMSVVQGLKTLD